MRYAGSGMRPARGGKSSPEPVSRPPPALVPSQELLVQIADERDDSADQLSNTVHGFAVLGGECGLHLEQLQLRERGSERIAELMLRVRDGFVQPGLRARVLR